MTAADLVSDLTQLLYVAAFVGTLVELVRRPRRASVDAALFFGILAVIVVTAQSLRYLQVSLSPVATTVLVAMLLALPYALLRLADDYRGVPRRASAAAIAGLVLSIALYLGVPPPYPAAMTLVIVAYFIAVLVYCAVVFGRGALASAGTTRARMRAVAIGTGLLALTIVVSGLRAFVPADLSGGLAVASALVALGSGVAFFVGFAPPDMLLRFWRESLLREFIGAAARLADTSDLAEVVRRIEVAAGRALGAGTVSISLDEARGGSPPATEPTDPLITLAAKAVRERKAVTIEVPSRDLAPAGARPVGHGARTLVAAPLVLGERVIGAIAVQGDRPSLFARDDLALLGIMADQAAIVIDNARLLATVRRLHEDERARGRETQARLAAIVDSSVDAVIGTTPEGIVTDWNPAAERLFGHAARDIVGTPGSVLIPPEEMAERQANVARILSPGEAPVVVSMLDAVRQRKDGTRVHVSIAAAPIRDAAGRTMGIASIVRDETERVEAERRRSDLETRLHQSERLESLGRLAGGVAHDLNNILAIVTNYADFLSDRLPADDPGADDLAQIKRAAERGTTFTRQLLTFARRGAVQPTALRLDELLGEMRSMLGRTLPESIVFELRVSTDVWSVVADRGQIEQVALNLVVNARDAMPSGGRLVVDAQNVEYDEISAAQHADLPPGRYVLLTVTDTGHGMSKEIADRAFDPFFTTKPTGQGTGLGLATVHGIVRQALGRVSIYSEVDRGTSVRVLLPVIEVAATQSEPARQPDAPVRPGAVILLVEDEPAVRGAARRILAGSGYQVIEAPDAHAALELDAARRGPIDLLVSDVVMPGLSGRELARRLRERRPELRVMYMSGYAEDAATGTDAFDGPLLTKPFARRPLLEMVNSVLGGALAAEPRPA